MGYLAEVILVRTLPSQLEPYGIEIKSIEVDELNFAHLKFSELSLASDDWQAQLLNASVVIDEQTNILFEAEYVAVGLNASQESDSPVVLGSLMDQLNDSIELLPIQGRIDEMRYCQTGLCLDTSISWRRDDSRLSAVAEFPAYGTWMMLEKEEIWTMSTISRTEEVDVVAEFSMEMSAALLNVKTSITAALKQAPAGLPAELVLQKISVDGVSKLPLSSSPDELVNDLISNNQVLIEGLVQAKYDELTLGSRGQYQFAVDYFEQDLKVTNQVLPEMEVALGELGSGTFRMDAGSRCTMSLGLGAVDCDVRGFASSWDVNHELGPYAADVNISQLFLEYAFGEVSATGELEVVAFDLSEGLEVLKANLAVELAEQRVSIGTRDDKSGLLGSGLRFTASHELEGLTGQGEFQWRGEGELGVVTDYLGGKLLADEALLELSKAPSGNFTLSSQLEWMLPDDASGLTLSHTTELALDQLALANDGYELRSGSFSSSLSGYPTVSADMLFTAGQVNVGVPMTDVRFEADFEANALSGAATLIGQKLELGLLGGQVTSTLMSYHHPQQAGVAVVNLEAVQLSELLALQQQDFDASGVLSGSVPVQLVDGNLSITNAEIAAQAPGGFIRYLADPSVRALANSNVGVGVVLDAMENFQYHTLDATVDYLPDGQMLAKTSLKGANPEYQDGREVHLNLSLEENILVLLQSLRLGSELAEQIGEKSDRFTN